MFIGLEIGNASYLFIFPYYYSVYLCEWSLMLKQFLYIENQAVHVVVSLKLKVFSLDRLSCIKYYSVW
mgnify:CR=1 FL=1